MTGETNEIPVPMRCITGCGFYGSPKTYFMCSVCFREFSECNAITHPPGDLAGLALASVLDTSLEDYEDIDDNTSGQTRNVPVATEEAVTPKPQTEPVVTQPTPSVSLHSTSQSEERASELLKPKKKRCFVCRKKLGLFGIECRCGNIFCGIHRYSDRHNCTYNYKAEGAEKNKR